MEIKRYTSPFDYEPVFCVLSEVFGWEEASLGVPGLDGRESEYNEDITYVAEENGEILGTVHLTIPHVNPKLCGVSGVCTTPAARGKGVGKALFGAAMDELDRRGVETTLLGTANPVAAKLYHSFGFSFRAGSNVMFRYAKGDTVDFERGTFDWSGVSARVVKGGPSLRIPLVPLVLHRGKFMVLDCNTGLVNCTHLTQESCMGLYPKYLNLVKRGGQFFGALNEHGVLGGVASVEPTDEGMRADLFVTESASAMAGLLLLACEQTVGDVYFQIADWDFEKQKMAEEFGFRPTESKSLVIRGMQIPATIWRP